jgi:hypothetical protein
MAYDYNRSKQLYEKLNDEQRQQFDTQNKDNANYQQFMKDYQAEQNQTTNQKPVDQKPLPTMETEKPIQQEQKPINQEQKPINQTVSPDLDQSKFNQAP